MRVQAHTSNLTFGWPRAATAFFAALMSAALGLCAAAHAQTSAFFPGVVYDPDVPTVETVLGHGPGDVIAAPDAIRTYFEALAAAAPERMRLVEMGESWQGRPLYYAVIANEDTMARLDEVQADIQTLADPRGLAASTARTIADALPGVVWLGHSVHGDEISPADAAMVEAYHLLAAQGDEQVDAILANAIVLIDPLQNPDGRARFVQTYYDARGLEAADSIIAAGRRQPWPGGRVNHYLFDMNRDWFARTQPETRARVDAFLDWRPLVFVDLHEMGSNSTYFFAPEADPYNPLITEEQKETLRTIGRNNARYFDEYGFAYFTREVYDAHYPGYGAGWPLFHGSVGTTYEQASARGEVVRQTSGTTFTHQDAVRHHAVAALATAETVAREAAPLWRAFHQYRSDAMTDGAASPGRTTVIARGRDAGGADRLARNLAAQGIEVRVAEAGFRACGADFAAGDYLVRMDQPAGRLARVLLDPDVPVDPEFMAEQERRRAKGLEAELYDVTAWSLPLMANVDVVRCDQAVGADFPLLSPDAPLNGVVEAPDAAYGFLVPWGDQSAIQLLAHALREGLTVRSADQGFTHNDIAYPSGTLVFARADQPAGQLGDTRADLTAALTRLAETTGARVVGIEDSWVTEGPSFGSSKMVPHPAPRVALAWGDAANRNAAGATRYVIEREIGYPVTPIYADYLTDTEMARFDVVILPDGGGYDDALGSGSALADWVSAGGVLITMGGATRWAGDPDTNLTALRREDAVAPEDAAEAEIDAGTAAGVVIADEESFFDVIRPAKARPDYVPGVLARATVDPDHWLSAGVAEAVYVVFEGSDIYRPIPLDAGTNVAVFDGPDAVNASGYLWAQNQEQLAYKPFVTAEEMGAGHVVAFTQDPTLRGYLDGLNILIANAIFRGAAHSDKPR